MVLKLFTKYMYVHYTYIWTCTPHQTRQRWWDGGRCYHRTEKSKERIKALWLREQQEKQPVPGYQIVGITRKWKIDTRKYKRVIWEKVAVEGKRKSADLPLPSSLPFYIRVRASSISRTGRLEQATRRKEHFLHKMSDTNAVIVVTSTEIDIFCYLAGIFFP